MGGSRGEFGLAVRCAARAFAVLAVACAVAAAVTGAGSAVARGQSAVALATQTLIPVADAYVDASNPSTNYGTSLALRVDGSPVVRSYLRFNLAGVSGTVTNATLRLYANTGLPAGYDVYGVADNTWGETTIKDSNAPPLAGTKTGSSGAVTAGTWTSVNVT